jgi:hypothetical protein
MDAAFGPATQQGMNPDVQQLGQIDETRPWMPHHVKLSDKVKSQPVAVDQPTCIRKRHLVDSFQDHDSTPPKQRMTINHCKY